MVLLLLLPGDSTAALLRILRSDDDMRAVSLRGVEGGVLRRGVLGGSAVEGLGASFR